MDVVERLRRAIRDVPDFPKPGILFRDLTPILGDPALFRAAVGLFVDRHRRGGADAIAAVEARGFLFAGAIAAELGLPLVPIRKKGKLPWRTQSVEYLLEYGSASLEIHADSVARGARVVVFDDLLATGGTAAAAGGLVEALGGRVVEFDFLVELCGLRGRERLGGRAVFAPLAL